MDFPLKSLDLLLQSDFQKNTSKTQKHKLKLLHKNKKILLLQEMLIIKHT